MWALCTFLLGVIVGVCLVAAGAWYVLSYFFHDPDKTGAGGEGREPEQPTSATFQLPPVFNSFINCK